MASTRLHGNKPTRVQLFSGSTALSDGTEITLSESYSNFASLTFLFLTGSSSTRMGANLPTEDFVGTWVALRNSSQNGAVRIAINTSDTTKVTVTNVTGFSSISLAAVYGYIN